MQIKEDFVRALPKTDLHVHLDGSVRLPTLIELAKEYDVSLPSYTVDGLKELVFKERYNNLGEYLHGFSYTVPVLQSEVALERAAFELAEDNFLEGVRYLEVRFAPQLHVHDRLNTVQVLKAVNRGLEQAKRAFNQQAGVLSGDEPAYEYGIICCAMRKFTAGFSEYFKKFMAVHRYLPLPRVYALASTDLAHAAVEARDQHGLPIVGFDLAGEEAGYPAEEHIEAYKYCQKHFLKKTVHAGEAYGPESIFQAVTDLGADRIGHGTYLLTEEAIKDLSIDDRSRYIERLGGYIADRRITLEVCLTSNLQTNPEMTSIADHTFKGLREARLSTTFCTDNRTVSSTTVTKEIMLAVEHLDLTPKDLKSIIVYGFKRSFYPGGYLLKRAYVRKIIDYYESIENRFLGENVDCD